MLFRPLKRWTVLGVGVPMTPGVIPSKRHEFARNMGRMVGDHLLTSREIGVAIESESFQVHLHQLIKARMRLILAQDMDSLPSLVPAPLRPSYDGAVEQMTRQITRGVQLYVRTEQFARALEEMLRQQLDLLLDHELNDFLTDEWQDKGFEWLEGKLRELILSAGFEEWLQMSLRQQAYRVLQAEKTMADFLPESVLELISTVLETHLPAFTTGLAGFLKEEEIQKGIAAHGRRFVEQFIDSMGPMGAMLKNMVKMETVEEKIIEYLQENEDRLDEFLTGDRLQERLSSLLKTKVRDVLQTPLVHFISQEEEYRVEQLCDFWARELTRLIRQPETVDQFARMVRRPLEEFLHRDGVSLREGLTELLDRRSLEGVSEWAIDACVRLIQSGVKRDTVDQLVRSLFEALLAQPVGRLSRLVSREVEGNLNSSLQTTATKLLKKEVVGLVQSLNIEKIIIHRIDSFDLLQLEQLLLSIMAEQFKYINLFGALIGLIIGCCNLFFILQ